MSIPALIPAGGSYSWNNLTGSIGGGSNYSGTITFSSDAAGASAITSVSGAIPGGGGNQTETIYAQGTITYTPTVTQNEVLLKWKPNYSVGTVTAITDNTGGGYTLIPAQDTSSGLVNVGSPYIINSGNTPSVALNSANQRWSSGSAPVPVNSDYPISSLTMPGVSNPESTWTVPPATIIEYIEVTVEVTYQLVYPASNAAYGITFTGATSQTFNVSGNGSTSQANFRVNSNGAVSFVLERTSGSWCSNVAYSACIVNTQGCGQNSWGCSQYVPQGNGSSNYWQAKLNGSGYGGYYEPFSKGSTQIYGRTGSFTNLAHGDTLTIDIKET
jgi:hypothetical protein